ncbi:MAG: hypothetical protein J6P98_08200 [Clostridia bacterium]|nr:hypothetical protein [Clostridia bacterium]
MLPIFVAAAVLAAALVKTTLLFRLKIRRGGVFASFDLRLFGLIPIRFSASLLPRCGRGFVLRVGAFRPRILHLLKRKRRFPKSMFRAVSFRRLTLSGSLGYPERPDITVLAVGALNAFFASIAALFHAKKAESALCPCFDRALFALNVEGIITASPAKIIIEAIRKGESK